MAGRIILPGEVGPQLEPSLTLEGIREMFRDMRRRGERLPNYMIVSERERRDLNQEILGSSIEAVAKEDQRPEHDGVAVGFVEGVMIRSHPDVPNGRARFIYPPLLAPEDKLPSGKVISLADPATPTPEHVIDLRHGD